jgi:hypothetical protein
LLGPKAVALVMTLRFNRDNHRAQHSIVERRTALFKLSVTVKPFEH